MNISFNYWTLIYTYPRQEKKLAKELAEYNLEVYLPLQLEKRKWHDRMKILEVPLFPCYLFVKPYNNSDLNQASSAKGFITYVKDSNKPVRIQASVIDNIKRALSVNHDFQIENIDLPVGKTKIITGGPFDGQNCEIVKYKGKAKVVVRLKILKRNILVDVPVSSLL